MTVEETRKNVKLLLLVAMVIAVDPGCTAAQPKVYRVTQADQYALRKEEEIKCQLRIEPSDELSTSKPGVQYCNTTWDQIMCWPAVEAGTLVISPCPSYIDNFLINGTASRECMADGTWFVRPSVNNSRGWTNYTLCKGPGPPAQQLPLTHDQMSVLRLMYNTGYGLSLVSLIIALATMLYFRKLHCSRNTIHVNLFVSFALRAIASFLRDNLFVQGLAFSKDLDLDSRGRPYLKEGAHWECKLFITIFNYILSANYMWIFVEGLYLHMLIFVSVFSERTSVCWYIILGWVGPLTFVIPWAVIRATVEDELCWNTHPTRDYFWVLNAPMVATVIVNFIFFVRVIWILFSKLQASHVPDGRRYRYVKLAKSTMVLIPLFGVPYIVFLWVPVDAWGHLETVKIYFEMIFNSFAGFLIAILFCFLNGEVQAEVRKTWQRFDLSRGSLRSSNRSVSNTMVTDVTRTRSSIPSIHSLHDTQPRVLLGFTDDVTDYVTDLGNGSVQCHVPEEHPERSFLMEDDGEEESDLKATEGVCTNIDEGVVLSEGESNL